MVSIEEDLSGITGKGRYVASTKKGPKCVDGKSVLCGSNRKEHYVVSIENDLSCLTGKGPYVLSLEKDICVSWEKGLVWCHGKRV